MADYQQQADSLANEKIRPVAPSFTMQKALQGSRLQLAALQHLLDDAQMNDRKQQQQRSQALRLDAILATLEQDTLEQQQMLERQQQLSQASQPHLSDDLAAEYANRQQPGLNMKSVMLDVLDLSAVANAFSYLHKQVQQLRKRASLRQQQHEQTMHQHTNDLSEQLGDTFETGLSQTPDLTTSRVSALTQAFIQFQQKLTATLLKSENIADPNFQITKDTLLSMMPAILQQHLEKFQPTMIDNMVQKAQRTLLQNRQSLEESQTATAVLVKDAQAVAQDLHTQQLVANGQMSRIQQPGLTPVMQKQVDPSVENNLNTQHRQEVEKALDQADNNKVSIGHVGQAVSKSGVSMQNYTGVNQNGGMDAFTNQQPTSTTSYVTGQDPTPMGSVLEAKKEAHAAALGVPMPGVGHNRFGHSVAFGDPRKQMSATPQDMPSPNNHPTPMPSR